MTDGQMAHQLGLAECPFWLEAASGLVVLPHAVDAVAKTEVHVHSVRVPEVVARVKAVPEDTQNLLKDMAHSQRRQTEMAVS